MHPRPLPSASPQTYANLLDAADDDRHQQLVIQHLYHATDPAFWVAGYAPERINRTMATLTALLTDVNTQLATRRSEFEETAASIQVGSDEWLSAKTEYEGWRRRALNFRRGVEMRHSIGKARQKTINMENVDRSGTYRKAMLELAASIQAHRDAMMSDAEPDLADFELWSVLATPVPFGGGATYAEVVGRAVQG